MINSITFLNPYKIKLNILFNCHSFVKNIIKYLFDFGLSYWELLQVLWKFLKRKIKFVYKFYFTNLYPAE